MKLFSLQPSPEELQILPPQKNMSCQCYQRPSCYQTLAISSNLHATLFTAFDRADDALLLGSLPSHHVLRHHALLCFTFLVTQLLPTLNLNRAEGSS